MTVDYDKPILVVDDDANVVRTIEKLLLSEGFQVIPQTSPLRALEVIREQGIEIVLSDLRMPEMGGIELMRKIKELDDDILVITMTAFGSERLAVTAMKAGAYDYLTKPLELDELGLVLKKAIERVRLVRENRVLTAQVSDMARFEEMVGQSAGIERVKELVRRVAGSDVTVLVTGESGTGKELVAQAIFEASPRSTRPYVKINCAAIPESLLESELFGHEKGSFTGAISRQLGKFELADGGTLFLDEVGDMPLSTQTKLLRVLQEQEFERIGGKDVIRVNVRIIAATNKDLAAEIEKGSFREDLFYRLNVIEIPLPPLRERTDDIPLLVEAFLTEFSKKYGKKRRTLPRGVMQRLVRYNWPGNVRQVRNCVERAVVLGMEKAENYEFLRLPSYGEHLDDEDEGIPSLAEVEVRHIRRILDLAEGNKTRAAKMLGIDPKTLRAKLKAFDPEEDDPSPMKRKATRRTRRRAGETE